MKQITIFLLQALFFYPCLFAQNTGHSELDYINYMTEPNAPKVVGSGKPVTERREIAASFDAVTVGNGMQLFIVPGEAKTIEVVAQAALLPLIRSEVADNKLTVCLTASLETSKGIKLYVPIGSLSKIEVKEGSYLFLPEQIKMDSLKMLLQSGATADCAVFSKTFSCKVMGGSTLKLSGKVPGSATIAVLGGSELKGKNFECSDCAVTVLGASKCRLTAQRTLNARVENESKLHYNGHPKKVQKATKLNGKIRRRVWF